MASLQAVADGLAGRLETIAGLRVYVWRRDQIAPPCVEVAFPERIEYDQTFKPSKTKWLIPLYLYASRVDAQNAHTAIAPFFDDRGAASLKGVIEADETLGGVADACLVLTADQFAPYSVGDILYLGCRLNVEVWTS